MADFARLARFFKVVATLPTKPGPARTACSIQRDAYAVAENAMAACGADWRLLRGCSEICATTGLCSWDPKRGGCFTTSNATCLKSRDCRSHGACTAKGGLCVPSTGTHCAKSKLCKNEGSCALGADNTCEPKSDPHCAASVLCARLGDCALRGRGCGPSTQAHCAKSKRCRDDGNCKLVGTACVVDSSEFCAAHPSCKISGTCGLWEGECAPTSEDHCEKSEDCAERENGCYYDEEIHMCGDDEGQ